eukprot:1158723-Pelagomonas_calceolata.AAC.1
MAASVETLLKSTCTSYLRLCDGLNCGLSWPMLGAAGTCFVKQRRQAHLFGSHTSVPCSMETILSGQVAFLECSSSCCCCHIGTLSCCVLFYITAAATVAADDDDADNDDGDILTP